MTAISMLSPVTTLDGSSHQGATVLVATDGTAQSDGALRVAFARADEMHAAVEVLAVLTPEPIMERETSLALWRDANLIRRERLRTAAESQLERLTGHPRVHAVTLLEGSPAFTIARVAIEQHAALVIVGIRQHNIADRLFSDETALQLARISRVPVLAVPSSATAMPHHAVVAIDFSDLSVRAAQAAIEAVSPDGCVDLVHVMPYVSEDPFTLEAKEAYQGWVEEQLDALRQKLVVPAGVPVSCAAIRGRPAPQLLAFAGRVGADVVVTGTHGRGFVARAFLGSITTKLMRAATCCVLTIPRDPLPSLAANAR